MALFKRWWQGLQAQREQAAVSRRAIPDDLWKRTLVRYPFLQRQAAADAAELRRLTSLFLDRKEFSTTGGLRLTDAMAVGIAAQAVLPVLHLGLDRYDGFVGIVVHPDQVVARREQADEDGVVHAYDELLSGEAMDGGPVTLSWYDVRTAGQHAASGYNVVIHEFAHVLDMADGLANGVPALPPGLNLASWQSTLTAEFERFVCQVDAGGQTVLDPYGAEAVEEFFAVASESFFVNPHEMHAAHPELYAMFTRFYLQDPMADSPRKRRA